MKNEEKSVTNIMRVGVDIAKTVFHIHAVDGRDKNSLGGSFPASVWLGADLTAFRRLVSLRDGVT